MKFFYNFKNAVFEHFWVIFATNLFTWSCYENKKIGENFQKNSYGLEKTVLWLFNQILVNESFMDLMSLNFEDLKINRIKFNIKPLIGKKKSFIFMKPGGNGFLGALNTNLGSYFQNSK